MTPGRETGKGEGEESSFFPSQLQRTKTDSLLCLRQNESGTCGQLPPFCIQRHIYRPALHRGEGGSQVVTWFLKTLPPPTVPSSRHSVCPTRPPVLWIYLRNITQVEEVVDFGRGGQELLDNAVVELNGGLRDDIPKRLHSFLKVLQLLVYHGAKDATNL